MLRKVLCALVVVLMLAGVSFGADATVVRYEKNQLVVLIGDKERTIEFNKKVHLHDENDKDIPEKDYAKYLTKGTKVEVVEENGKVVEVCLKKK